ncbi:unnamed protein product [Peronospora farinosa]|uniref:Uncharacterized protein n=1 Tax=Peronospora farinosa TaxID=134698 RepID=A0AAV0UQP5_9STRA|nr:unnamed protein product [Peronospora farinosa]
MTKVMQGKDFLKLLERYLARATENVIHGVDDIVTGLEANDATFREKYYIPAVVESKRPHYVKSIDLTKFLSM